MWGSAIGGAFNLMSQAISDQVNNKRIAEQNKFNKQLFDEQLSHEQLMAERAQDFNASESEKAWKRDVEMWNMQNNYNSPTEQMRRYKDAGLNPNLIYGQGTSGNATNSPNYSPAQGVKPNAVARPEMKANLMQPTKFADDFNILEEYQTLQSVNNAKAQEENMNSQTALTDEKTIAQAIDNTYKVAHHELDLDLKEIQFKVNAGIISKNKAEEEYFKVKTKFEERTLKYREQYLSGQIDYQEAQTKKVDKEIEAISHDVDLKTATLLKIQEETKHIQNANEKASVELKMLQDEYDTQLIINGVKKITGRENFGNDPLSVIQTMIARGEIAIGQIIDSF